MKKFDAIVYIGRFQPFHNGHLATIMQAFELADEVVIVLGSAGEAPNVKNPFTESEREWMIRNSLPYSHPPVHFVPMHNKPGSDKEWADDVRREVARYVDGWEHKVGLTGMRKDASSFYLDLFPEWEFVPGPNVPLLNATDVRIEYFRGDERERWARNVPSGTATFLDEYKEYERYHFIASQIAHLLTDEEYAKIGV